MAVEVKHAMGASVQETLALALDLVSTTPTVAHLSIPAPTTLNASSTPPVTKVYSDTLPLSGGAVTIDLMTLVGAMGSAVTFDGLKVQFAYFYNPVGNNTMTIEEGDANPYQIFGSAAGLVVLHEGCTSMQTWYDQLEDADATHSDIKITGTGVEEINVVLVAG